MVTINDFPPTAQDEAVRKYLTRQVDEHLNEYNKLVKEDLAAFNKDFAKLNLDYLTLD